MCAPHEKNDSISNTTYRPDITIGFLRTQNLPASYAKFHVPLWFSKLDLRDYLYHVYNVRIISVRSYVKQQRVTMKELNGRTQPNRWHRPRAHKFMTVELERPFVWPEEPEDYSEWNQDEVEESEKEQKKFSELHSATSDTIMNEDRRKSMREQAKALLEGREKWKPVARTSVGQTLSR